LKNEVYDLQCRLSSMNEDLQSLTGLVGVTLKTQPQKSFFSDPFSKKRKHDPSSVYSTAFPELSDSNYNPLPIGSTESERDYLMNDVIKSEQFDLFVPGSVKQGPFQEKYESNNTFNSQDDEMLASLFALDSNEEIRILREDCGREESHVDPALVCKLEQAISKLPLSMEAVFVDRLVSVIAEPELMRNQISALTSLVTSCADEARASLPGTGDTSDSPQAIQLATSILGAYLAQYAAPMTHLQFQQSNQFAPPRSTQLQQHRNESYVSQPAFNEM
jgi:hypothetical protein